MTIVRPCGAARGLLPLVVLLALAGCKLIQPEDKDENPQGTGDPANWSIAVSVPRTGLTIQQGTSDSVLITVTRAGGYTGEVMLNLSPIQGFTATLRPPVTSGTTTTAMLFVSVPPAFTLLNVPFSFFVGVAPSTSSVAERSIEFSLTVTPKPGLFIQTPTSVTIPASGAAVNVPFSVLRTQFPDDISFSLINAPAGITATFAPNPLTGGATQSVMTIRTNGTVAGGTYTGLGLRANAGLPSQGTAPFTVVVTP